jgi:hypothetical protein
MTTNFTFNTSEVTCNGNMGGSALVLNQENEAKIKTFMKMHFMMTDRQTILQELQDSGMLEGKWIVGSRVNSIETVYCRFTSGLLSYALRKFAPTGGTYKAQRETAEMWLNAQVKMMSASDIIMVLEKALVDCATADYHYAYEKMWA